MQIEPYFIEVKGQIGKSGRYKDKTLESSSISFSSEEVDFTNFLKNVNKILSNTTSYGITFYRIVLIVGYLGQCSFHFSHEELYELSKIENGLSVDCFEVEEDC